MAALPPEKKAVAVAASFELDVSSVRRVSSWENWKPEPDAAMML